MVFYSFYDGAVDMQIWVLLTRSQCKVSDSQVTVKACGHLITWTLSLAGNLSIGQTCLDDVQCKGTENGGNCLKGVCFCEKGFVIQNLRCLQGKLLLLVISNIYSNYYYF